MLPPKYAPISETELIIIRYRSICELLSNKINDKKLDKNIKLIIKQVNNLFLKIINEIKKKHNKDKKKWNSDKKLFIFNTKIKLEKVIMKIFVIKTVLLDDEYFDNLIASIYNPTFINKRII